MPLRATLKLRIWECRIFCRGCWQYSVQSRSMVSGEIVLHLKGLKLLVIS